MSTRLTMAALRGLNVVQGGRSVKPVLQNGNAAQIAGRCERRDPTTGLNQTEAGFLEEVLRPLELAGVILRIDFEPEGLRAGLPGSRSVYWPDFRIQWADGVIDFVEVKGHWLEDARVKIKAVAALHPYTFHAVTRRPKKRGGGWKFETFGPWASWEERAEVILAGLLSEDRGEAIEETLESSKADP